MRWWRGSLQAVGLGTQFATVVFMNLETSLMHTGSSAAGASAVITPALIALGAAPRTKQEAIRAAGALLVQAGCVDAAYVDSLLAREQEANTYLGSGVAIPHGQAAMRHLIRRTGVAVLQVPQGVQWGETSSAKVRLVLAIAADSQEHLALLRRLTRLLQDDVTIEHLSTTGDVSAILAAFEQPIEPSGAVQAQALDFEQGFDFKLDYPNGLHARPAQRWVQALAPFSAQVRVRLDTEVADARRLMALLQLGAGAGAKLRVSAQGADAVQALAALQATMLSLSAAEAAEAHAATIARAVASVSGSSTSTLSPCWQPISTTARCLRGVGASPGLAVGIVQRVGAAAEMLDAHVADTPESSLGAAADALHTALECARAQLLELAAQTDARLGVGKESIKGQSKGDIFRAQAQLLADAALLESSCALISQGHGVAWSWQCSVRDAANKLAAVDNPVLAARAADLRDVGARVLAVLQQGGANATVEPIPRTGQWADFGQVERVEAAAGLRPVIVALDLAPSDTAALDVAHTAALCTAQGGPSAHTAILARTLGLPAVVAVGEGLLELPEGERLIIDGDAGCVYFHLSDADIDSAQAAIVAASVAAQALQTLARENATTACGTRVEVAANLTRADQVEAALAAGAQGVGLMRTEFLYLEREHAPSEQEQYTAYRNMLQALAGKPLIVRTLDIGGDKRVPYLGLPKEENPFLGVRGTRLLLRRADLLHTQLRAIYRAARDAQCGAAQLSIMFPMITSVEEITAVKAACERVRCELQAESAVNVPPSPPVPELPLGIMVEVPAAAVMADQLAMHVDFFSIGTNDLTQYVLAMDRQHPELAAQADSLHPAVLRMVAQTVQGAAAATAAGHPCWVGVCGGMAGDALGASILVGLGVKELSMSPRDIARVKATLRGRSLEQLQTLANNALRCADATCVRELVG